MRALLAVCPLDRFRDSADTAAERRVLNPEASSPEGPLVKDGKLYYAEYGAHKVSLWDGATNQVFWSKEGCGPSAIIPFGRGFRGHLL